MNRIFAAMGCLLVITWLQMSAQLSMFPMFSTIAFSAVEISAAPQSETGDSESNADDASANSDDKVTVRHPSAKSGKLVYSGVIEEANGSSVVLRVRPGEDGLREFPADDVLKLETRYTPPHLAANQAWSNGLIFEAAKQYDAALLEEKRNWVRREILAGLMKCALATEDWQTAASRFQSLISADPQSRHFRSIPLVWAAVTIPADARGAALNWLSSPIAAMRLVAASWLLMIPEHTESARKTLTALTRDRDSRVAFFATAQLWRLQRKGAELPVEQLVGWHNKVLSESADLRHGPMYLVARAYADRERWDVAAALWLLPITAGCDDYLLASRSTLEAARALHLRREVDAAIALLQEIETRFPESAAAAEATALRKEWTGAE